MSADLFRVLADPPANTRLAIGKTLVGSALRAGCSGDGRIYLNIGHTGLDDDGFARWIRGADVRPVYLVHDLIPITHPEYCREGEQLRHKRRMRTVLETAKGVIGNSQATIDELSDFSAAEGLPMPPAMAAWLGISTPRNIRQAPDLDRPTFVALGTIEARKNHLMLLQVWMDLIQALGPEAPRLLVIGQRGWECQDVFELLDRSETLKTAVEELSDCNDDAIADRLSSARALLFPSLVEGYGLPLIEALQVGTTVIASDLPVFREIGQGIPEFLDPMDRFAWKDAILTYAEANSDRRDAQLMRAKAFRPPTWQDHFAKIDSWLTGL